ncbi:MAG: OadG family protein [PS1 clade bacterium]
MEESDLLVEAINLTMFGMGFVFLFLTLLVFVTNIMSIIIRNYLKNQQEKLQKGGINGVYDSSVELDEETKFVIEQAIKMHRRS